jgi:riboflavin transporter FmnP
MSEVKEGEIESIRSKRTELLIQIAGAAIFAALSIAISPIVSIIPRLPGWGFAFFDPTSIPWIVSFVIFGPIAGILSTSIGSIGLVLWDPTGIGPMFKFLATIPLILVPTIFMRLYKQGNGEKTSNKLMKPLNYAIYGIIALIVRIVLMLIINGALFGWSTYVITFVLLLNSIQTAFDLIVPYIIAFGLRYDEKLIFW